MGDLPTGAGTDTGDDCSRRKGSGVGAADSQVLLCRGSEPSREDGRWKSLCCRQPVKVNLLSCADHVES